MKRSLAWREPARPRTPKKGAGCSPQSARPVHVHLGYSSFSEYIERLFGYQARSLQERLRVAEALEGLPALARALSSGELSWSAVRELTRVPCATPSESGSSSPGARRCGNSNRYW
jgi:hypothetical protein